MGWVVGILAGSILRIRREHVESSMERAGIARSEAGGMYASLGTALFEFLWMAGRPRGAFAGRVRFTERARQAIAESRASGRGLIMATAHTGNWDLSACAAARDLVPLTVVTKRLHAERLDDFWQGERRAQGIELIDGEGIVARATDAVERGRGVALIVDQAPERAGHELEIPFLGAKARCDRTAAVLAMRARVPLVLALGRRLADGSHLVDFPVVRRPPVRSSNAWVDEVTASLQAELDTFVRAHPSQWLWLHRRWKGKIAPPGGARESMAEGRAAARSGLPVEVRPLVSGGEGS
jgi:KDO2-lipid IV(A) lauroyltransferase